MGQIDTVAGLRSLIPEPHPLNAAKVIDHIDDHAARFIAMSPFLCVATSDAAGRMGEYE